jgi:hypothetical protein
MSISIYFLTARKISSRREDGLYTVCFLSEVSPSVARLFLDRDCSSYKVVSAFMLDVLTAIGNGLRSDSRPIAVVEGQEVLRETSTDEDEDAEGAQRGFSRWRDS